ncbi:MAG: hypothetical protein JRH20_31855, partial [Deltaproteobacteria bacterium]|nr:hypothetical protein [Deltaproteobacteria bacterium]
RNVPRWADEGIAMTAESRRSKRRRVLALRRAVHHGPFYRAETLMSTKRYPERKYIHLYYAQSYALTRFFIARGGPTRFIAFLQQLRTKGTRKALWDNYRIGDVATLERLYLAYARSLVRSVAYGG